jgi:hypothetical protein
LNCVPVVNIWSQHTMCFVRRLSWNYSQIKNVWRMTDWRRRKWCSPCGYLPTCSNINIMATEWFNWKWACSPRGACNLITMWVTQWPLCSMRATVGPGTFRWAKGEPFGGPVGLTNIYTSSLTGFILQGILWTFHSCWGEEEFLHFNWNWRKPPLDSDLSRSFCSSAP